jgi:hypothetical protein
MPHSNLAPAASENYAGNFSIMHVHLPAKELNFQDKMRPQAPESFQVGLSDRKEGKRKELVRVSY